MISSNKDILKYGVQLQFPTTNNEVEYEEILTSLRLAKDLGVKSLVIKSDSKLIIKQVNHEYEAKEEWMHKGQLYKQRYTLPYLKCLNPQEANYALREIYEGIYKNHLGPRSLVNKVIRVGYF